MSTDSSIKFEPDSGTDEPCPDGRLSNPTKQFGGRRIVDVNNYIPYFLVAINSALSRGASHLYLRRFGVGIVEWRVISMLAIEPRISAARICKVVSLDKSGTSRALKRLLSRGYLSYSTSKTDPRRKIWWLNARGYALHDRILAVALEREKKLIDGVSPADLETFLKVVRIMHRNVDRISDA